MRAMAPIACCLGDECPNRCNAMWFGTCTGTASCGRDGGSFLLYPSRSWLIFFGNFPSFVSKGLDFLSSWSVELMDLNDIATVLKLTVPFLVERFPYL